MKSKELIWVPAEVAEAHKTAESQEEKDRVVLKYVDGLKRDFSSAIEMLDEDVVMYEAKLIKYKNGLSKVYDKHVEEIESMWDMMDKTISKAQNQKDRAIKTLDILENKIESIYKRLESFQERFRDINEYTLGATLGILERIGKLSPETQEILMACVKKENDK